MRLCALCLSASLREIKHITDNPVNPVNPVKHWACPSEFACGMATPRLGCATRALTFRFAF